MEQGYTSVDVVRPLLQQGAQLALWKTCNLEGLKEKVLPDRWKELMGVQHMKVHVIDNKVLMSGANLSRTYFSDRQDRYVVIEDAALSQFYHELLTLVARHSKTVSRDGVIIDATRPMNSSKFGHDLREMWLRHAAVNTAPPSTAPLDHHVIVAPTIQMGLCNVTVDQRVTMALFKELSTWKRVVLATGYFNMPKEYADAISTHLGGNTEILVASMQASPWHNAKGASRNVPNAYAFLQREFLKRLESKRLEDHLYGNKEWADLGKQHEPTMLEWRKNDWSFHCKGTWAFRDPNAALTVLGSANLGLRSVLYDLETQVVMLSESESFRTKLEAELNHIRKDCLPEPLSISKLNPRMPPKWQQAIIPLIKRWM